MSLSDVIKKGSTTPAPGDLIEGGLGIDTVNKVLYSKSSSGVIFPINSSDSNKMGTQGLVGDYIATGLLIPASASLTSSLGIGEAYVSFKHVIKSTSSPHTYTASKDTYVDMSSEGVLTFLEQTLGGAEPAVTADSLRLAKVVTDAATIPSVVGYTYPFTLVGREIDTDGTLLDTHTASTSNPHGVTKVQVGLANVDDTSDLNKPISSATQTALDTHTGNTINPHTVTKTQVGLGNVDNTSDLNKPISTATQTAIDNNATEVLNHINDATGAHAATAIANTPLGNILATNVQAAINELDSEKEPADVTILKDADIGVTVQPYDATLEIGATADQTKVDIDALGINATDLNGQSWNDVTTLISTTGHVVSGRSSGGVALTADDGYGNANVTFNHTSGNPEQAGNAGRIVVNTDALTNADMVFSVKSGVTAGTSISTVPVLTLTEGVANVDGNITLTGTVDGRDLATDGTTLDTHTGSISNPHAVTKTQVGLGNVDNTSDLGKPVSTATQTALDGLRFLVGITNYGISWDESADTYVRTGDTDFTAIQSKMRRCLLAPDGTVNTYLDATDSNYTESGSVSDLTGLNGNVMVEIPKFYIKYSYVGTTHSWSISNTLLEGYSVHPAFIKAGVEVDHRYIGAYAASTDGTVLKSVSGEYCDTNLTRAIMRTRAAAIGSGWSLQDWNLVSAVQLLMLVEFGTFNSQSAIGEGRTQLSGGTFADGSYYALNGLSNGIGNATGSVAYNGLATDVGADAAYMSYRGIEHFYGNVWSWVDGINIRDNVPFINNNPATFADDVFTGDYVSAGITMANVSGWQNALGQVGTGFFPTSVGASSTTKITDFYSQYAGDMVAMLGGVASNGDYSGAFFLRVSDPSIESFTYTGAVLAY